MVLRWRRRSAAHSQTVWLTNMTLPRTLFSLVMRRGKRINEEMPGFWSTETLKDRVDKEKIITPYDDSAVKACCYELGVGEEAFVTGESAKKIILKEGDSVAIPPGQVVLILTREMIKMPLDAIGLLSIKFGLKARGLINISGFHVDPGFEGNLVFSMYQCRGPNHPPQLWVASFSFLADLARQAY